MLLIGYLMYLFVKITLVSLVKTIMNAALAQLALLI